jgi:predicted amidohydrolase YtcJ
LAFGLRTLVLFGQQSAPDLILSNGTIITVDDRFTIAQAVAVTGDRITAVRANQKKYVSLRTPTLE